MKNRRFLANAVATLMLASFTTAPAIAGKPEWAGKPGAAPSEQRGKAPQGGRNPGAQSHGGGDLDVSVSFHFGDSHRSASREYYRTRYTGPSCPPGLAKKQNGCMPPGLARKWSLGRPLARDVIFHDLPADLVILLGAPPPRHRYVRVDGDILVIAITTGVVVDAILDLGW